MRSLFDSINILITIMCTSQPYHNIMVTNSSFEPQSAVATSTTSAYVLPNFTYVPRLHTTTDSVQRFFQAFALPTTLHPAHNALTQEDQSNLKRQTELEQAFPDAINVDHILVLICGHGGRDSRCGLLGPLLRDEFSEKLTQQGIHVLDSTSKAETKLTSASQHPRPSARVGLISHIGGHKYVYPASYHHSDVHVY